MTHNSGNAAMEKRKHKRIQYGRTVNVITEDGASLQLEVLDYSMGGMGLVGDRPFAKGDVLDVESIITLEGDKRMLDLKGEVVHTQEQFQEFAFGISFL